MMHYIISTIFYCFSLTSSFKHTTWFTLRTKRGQRYMAPPSVLVKTFQSSERASEFETLEVRVSGPSPCEHSHAHQRTRTVHKQLQHISLTEFGVFFCFVEDLKVALIQNHHESHHILHSLDRCGSFKRPVPLSGSDELLGKQDARDGGKRNLACLASGFISFCSSASFQPF